MDIDPPLQPFQSEVNDDVAGDITAEYNRLIQRLEIRDVIPLENFLNLSKENIKLLING